MAVYKRGPVWWVSVWANGQRVRCSAGAGSSRRDALALEASIRARVRADTLAGKLGERPRRTFGEALLRWTQTEAPRLRDTTWKSKARLVRPLLENLWLEDVPAAVGAIRALDLAPATINRRLALVRRVLNCAEQWGWTSEPLGRRIKLLPERNARHIYLTPEEVENLATASVVASEPILLLAYTGLRLSELWRLSASDAVSGHLVVRESKSGRPRIVPLPDRVRHCTIPVSITRNRFRRAFEQARVAIERPELHAHDLRHTYASWLVQANASPAAVRDLLGHANLTVTSRYAHLATSHLWDAVKRIGTDTISTTPETGQKVGGAAK